jgi:hypothetical protein
MFVVGNSNGLLASSATHRSLQTVKPYYLTQQSDGDVVVDGTLFVDTIEPVSTTEPVYIKAPNELGGEMLNNSALVVEGGANRNDVNQLQVSIATYKPLTRGTIDYGQGEQVGSLSMWGKDTSANDTKYVDVRGVITNPTNGAEESRVNFVLQKAGVALTLLQLDTSENVVKTLTNTRLQAGGNIIGLADISCAGDVYVGDDLFVNDDVNCADVLATASIQANRFVSLGTTVPSALAGTTYRVNGIDAGRVNHDSVNMNITGLTGTAGAVQQICGTQVATRTVKDASDNITMTIGSSVAPGATLRRQTTAGTATYYPGAVKICDIGSITKQTSATLVPESAFTVPAGYDGYYSYTAQISMDTVGTVADGDILSIYLDLSGGSLTPVAGSINIIDIAENANDVIFTAPSGIIMQRLVAGNTIQLYHSEAGTYTFSNGAVRVAYSYLGDTAL